MDGNRFDDFSRRLATRLSRRRVLVGVAASALPVASADAAARPTCRPFASGCTRDAQCCTGICARGSRVPRASRNKCACPAGQSKCPLGCFDLTSDEQACGACGVVCPDAQVCMSGVCTCPEAGETYCPEFDACFDLQTDVDHCGACGNACGFYGDCDAGVCPEICSTIQYTGRYPKCIETLDGREVQTCDHVNFDPVSSVECDEDSDCTNTVRDCSQPPPFSWMEHHECYCAKQVNHTDMGPSIANNSPKGRCLYHYYKTGERDSGVCIN
jgi:hypothetical protein